MMGCCYSGDSTSSPYAGAEHPGTPTTPGHLEAVSFQGYRGIPAAEMAPWVCCLFVVLSGWSSPASVVFDLTVAKNIKKTPSYAAFFSRVGSSLVGIVCSHQRAKGGEGAKYHVNSRGKGGRRDERRRDEDFTHSITR